MSMSMLTEIRKVVKTCVWVSSLCLLMPLSSQAEGLNMGMVDGSPSSITKKFTPLLKYLNSKGVATGKVVTVKTLDGMAKKMSGGGRLILCLKVPTAHWS